MFAALTLLAVVYRLCVSMSHKYFSDPSLTEVNQEVNTPCPPICVL